MNRTVCTVCCFFECCQWRLHNRKVWCLFIVFNVTGYHEIIQSHSSQAANSHILSGRGQLSSDIESLCVCYSKAFWFGLLSIAVFRALHFLLLSGSLKNNHNWRKRKTSLYLAILETMRVSYQSAHMLYRLFLIDKSIHFYDTLFCLNHFERMSLVWFASFNVSHNKTLQEQ